MDPTVSLFSARAHHDTNCDAGFRECVLQLQTPGRSGPWSTFLHSSLLPWGLRTLPEGCSEEAASNFAPQLELFVAFAELGINLCT